MQLGNRLAIGERLRHRLAVELGQTRLVIERLKMGRPASHAEKNHPLGLGCKIGKARQPLLGLRGSQPIRLGQARKRSGTQAKRSAAEEGTAVDLVQDSLWIG